MNPKEELDRCTYRASEFAATMPQTPVCYFKDAIRIAEAYAKEKVYCAFKYRSMLGHVTPDWDMMDKEFKECVNNDFEKWWEENK